LRGHKEVSKGIEHQKAERDGAERKRTANWAFVMFVSSAEANKEMANRTSNPNRARGAATMVKRASEERNDFRTQ
jgi:hypothetical protein